MKTKGEELFEIVIFFMRLSNKQSKFIDEMMLTNQLLI